MPNQESGTSFYQEFSGALRAPEMPSSSAPGLAIYRNNTRAAFLKVLQETFPVTQKLVGEEFFRFLAREYFHHYPASSPWVRDYGRRLPKFLASFAPVSHLGYLPDVAQIELLWLEAYHEREAVPLNTAALQAALSDEAAPQSRFAFHPSLRLFASSHPAATLWKHNRKSDGPLSVNHMSEHILIARPQAEVEVRTIGPEVFETLSCLMKGDTLEVAIVGTATSEPEKHLSNVLRLLLETQIVTSVHSEIFLGSAHEGD